MTEQSFSSLIVADVGNSGVKLGSIRHPGNLGRKDNEAAPRLAAGDIIAVNETELTSTANEHSPVPFQAWLERIPTPVHCWYASSVNKPLETKLAAWVHGIRPRDKYSVLEHQHFPLTVDLRFPDRVGTDRLAAGVAVNTIREPNHPAIIIDAGTAITIDVLSVEGAFLGGVILPGLEAAAAALADATDALPRLEPQELWAPPDPIGKTTRGAMQSGIVWGCIGAIREHVTRIRAQLPQTPEIHCTGGSGRYLAPHVGDTALFDPHLVLKGIAATAVRQGHCPKNEKY